MSADKTRLSLPGKKRKHAVTTASSYPPSSSFTHSSSPSTPTPKQNRIAVAAQETLKSDPSSPFCLISATLYFPLSPISISSTHAKASLITEHLSPLLLTYYPPFKGIVMGFSNEWISNTLPKSAAGGAVNTNNGSALALTANEYGVLYLYLTATFLVLSPQRGQVLEGWVNVQSEGFLGAIAYNLFSVGIERKRVHRSWKWVPPGAGDDTAVVSIESTNNRKQTDEEGKYGSQFDPEKEHFTPLSKPVLRKPIATDDTRGDEHHAEAEEEHDDLDVSGYFQSISGHRVKGTIHFRVHDVDVIPGADPDRGFLSIEGTMLTPEEEARLVEEERSGLRQPHLTAMSGGISQPPRAENRLTDGFPEQRQTPIKSEKMEDDNMAIVKKEKRKKKNDMKRKPMKTEE